MLVSAILLASSSISVPSVGNVTGFFSVAMNLERLWHHGRQIAATVNLWVEPNSKVTECSLGRFLGDEVTAKSFCSLLIGRKVSFPRDSQGQKTYAFLTVRIAVNVRGSDKDFEKLLQDFDHLPIVGDADAEIAVSDVQFPVKKAHRMNVEYGIEVEVATDGTVTACQKEDRTPQEIAEKACSIAKAKQFTIRYSADKQPVSYVRNVRVVAQSAA